MYSIITSVVWLSLYNYFNAYLRYGNLLYITVVLVIWLFFFCSCSDLNKLFLFEHLFGNLLYRI